MCSIYTFVYLFQGCQQSAHHSLVININNKMINQEEYKRIQRKYQNKHPSHSIKRGNLPQKHNPVPQSPLTNPTASLSHKSDTSIGKIVKIKKISQLKPTISYKSGAQQCLAFPQKAVGDGLYDSILSSKLTQYKNEQFLNKVKYSQMINYNEIGGYLREHQLNIDHKATRIEQNNQNEPNIARCFIPFKNKINNECLIENYQNVIQSFQAKKRLIDGKINTLKQQASNQAYKLKHLQKNVFCSNDKMRGLNDHKYSLMQENFQTLKHQNFYKSKSTHINDKSNGKDKGTLLCSMMRQIRKRKRQQWRPFIEAVKNHMQLEQRLKKLKQSIPKNQENNIFKTIHKEYSIQTKRIKLHEEQFDPFQSTPAHININQMVQLIVDAFQETQDHWKTCLQHMFEPKIVQEIFDQLAKGKHIISLKEFVREFGLILHNEKYLRNRDLFRIYKRIEPFNRQNFIKVFSKSQK